MEEGPAGMLPEASTRLTPPQEVAEQGKEFEPFKKSIPDRSWW